MAEPTFQEAARTCDEFLALLDELGIHIEAGSTAQEDALAMTEVVEIAAGRLAKPADPRPLVRRALGFVDMAGKVLAARGRPGFDQLIPHLKLLTKASIPQNTKSLVTDDASNKVIELYVAAMALRVADDVALDHPVSSRGDNPDVMFDFRGKRWAIALKTSHSTHSQTMFDAIAKGADQIEASDADHGLVLINLKNVLRHDVLWPNPNVSQPEELAKSALKSEILTIVHGLDVFPAAEWLRLLGPDRKAKPPVLFLGHTVFSAVPTHGDGSPRFMPVKIMLSYLTPLGDPVGAVKLAHALTHEMQELV